MISSPFVIVGALLQIVGVASYMVAMFKGDAQPNRVSWFLWALGPLVAFSAELNYHIGLVALMTFTVGFGPLLIFLGSFISRGAKWKLTRLDVTCGALSLGGLMLWQLTGEGYLAIALSIVSDLLAWIPTFVKSFQQPETENWHYFFFDATSAALALLAIDRWTFANWAWPVWIFASCASLVVVIKFKPGARNVVAL
jgi:hypothetical protein